MHITIAFYRKLGLVTWKHNYYYKVKKNTRRIRFTYKTGLQMSIAERRIKVVRRSGRATGPT